MSAKPQFLIKTFGCKVNQIEGQAIREKFLQKGFQEAQNESGLDVVIINTCTVTQNADSRSRRMIRHFHKLNPKTKILVTGCYAEKDQKILRSLPGVFLVVGQNEKAELADKFFSQAKDLKKKTFVKSIYQDLPVSRFKGHTRAFLKVQDGCSRNCSYCKIKIVRGPSRSRRLGDSVVEAERLVQAGHKEIVLTGIQLGAYGLDLKPKTNLEELTKKLLEITGLSRIRLSSVEPGDISKELIHLMATNERIARHLHIPLQSGDDTVLKKMKRGYTKEFYVNLIHSITSKMNDFCLSMDVMIGFPGESEEAFNNTLKTIEMTQPIKVHIFPYSRREGTQAAGFTETTPSETVKRRLKKIKLLTEQISEERKKNFIGTPIDVLVEGYKSRDGVYSGYSSQYLPVRIKSKENILNKMLRLKTKKMAGSYLLAEKVEKIESESLIFSAERQEPMLES